MASPIARRELPAPIARRADLLRIAFGSVGGFTPVSGGPLERASIYSERRVSCRKCDGTGRLSAPAEANWSKQNEAFELLGIGDLYKRNCKPPAVRVCPTCKGKGDVDAKGRRINLTARPTGSSLSAAANTFDEWVPLVIARASRIARRVEAESKLHGYVLRAYYGSDFPFCGRMAALYPFTDTGQRLLNETGKADDSHFGPWRELHALSSRPEDEVQAEFRFVELEAYTLLCDAVSMWDVAVGQTEEHETHAA